MYTPPFPFKLLLAGVEMKHLTESKITSPKGGALSEHFSKTVANERNFPTRIEKGIKFKSE